MLSYPSSGDFIVWLLPSFIFGFCRFPRNKIFTDLNIFALSCVISTSVNSKSRLSCFAFFTWAWISVRIWLRLLLSLLILSSSVASLIFSLRSLCFCDKKWISGFLSFLVTFYSKVHVAAARTSLRKGSQAVFLFLPPVRIGIVLSCSSLAPSDW